MAKNTYEVKTLGTKMFDGKSYVILQIEDLANEGSKRFYIRKNDFFFRKSEPRYYLPKYNSEVEEIYKRYDSGAKLHTVKKIEEE